MNDSIDFIPTQARKNTAGKWAVASLVCGILSLVFICCLSCLLYASPVAAILAIVFAFVARSKNGGRMPGKAIAGLVLGIIALVIFVLLMILVISLFANDMAGLRELYDTYLKEAAGGISFEEFIEQAAAEGSVN